MLPIFLYTVPLRADQFSMIIPVEDFDLNSEYVGSLESAGQWQTPWQDYQ